MWTTKNSNTIYCLLILNNIFDIIYDESYYITQSMKYNVIKISAQDVSAEIIATFNSHELAIQHMNKVVNDRFKPSKYLRLYHEHDGVSVWETGYIFGKTLICKFYTIPFNENELIEIPGCKKTEKELVEMKKSAQSNIRSVHKELNEKFKKDIKD